MSGFEDGPKPNDVDDLLGLGQFQGPHGRCRYSEFGDPSILGDNDYQDQADASWDIGESASAQVEEHQDQELDLDLAKGDETSVLAARCPLLKTLIADSKNHSTTKSGGSEDGRNDGKYVNEWQGKEQLKIERKHLEKSKRNLLKKTRYLEECAKKIEEEESKLAAEKLNLKFQKEDLEEQRKVLENEKVAFECKRQGFMECENDILTYASLLRTTVQQIQDFQL